MRTTMATATVRSSASTLQVLCQIWTTLMPNLDRMMGLAAFASSGRHLRLSHLPPTRSPAGEFARRHASCLLATHATENDHSSKCRILTLPNTKRLAVAERSSDAAWHFNIYDRLILDYYLSQLLTTSRRQISSRFYIRV